MIITLTGDNSFGLNQQLEQLKHEFLAAYDYLGYERLDAEDVDAARIVEAAQSLPFLAAKKLLVVRRPSAQRQLTDNIETIIKAVPETTDLVIIEPKLDKRSAYFKVLKSQTDFREFSQTDAHNLNNWIVQYTKDQQGTISLADANYLIERLGSNQQLLASELNKLLAYDDVVNRQSIDALTEPTPQSTIFELLDAAFAGNTKRVLHLYQEQRALKVEPQQIIAMLAWQLHLLALVKAANKRNAEEIAREAKISPYVIRKTMGLAQKMSLVQLKQLVHQALKLDIRLKSESINADDALQHYLLTISS